MLFGALDRRNAAFHCSIWRCFSQQLSCSRAHSVSCSPHTPLHWGSSMSPNPPWLSGNSFVVIALAVLRAVHHEGLYESSMHLRGSWLLTAHFVTRHEFVWSAYGASTLARVFAQQKPVA